MASIGKVGPEVLVNTVTQDFQWQPAITGLTGGGHVVSWVDESNGPDIRAQVFGADGAPLGGEFRVSAGPAGLLQEPDIAALAGGGFVAVWTDESGIVAQVFAADGSQRGAGLAIADTGAGAIAAPTVTGLGTGGFAVAWQDEATGTVRARTFGANGTATGGVLPVGTAPAATIQAGPDITALAGGGFVVTWYDDAAGTLGVKAQVFAAGGAAIGGEVAVSGPADADQWLPSVTALTGGGFVVTWQDPAAGAIHAQAFAADGARAGAELLVAAHDGGAAAPAVAALAGGGFVVAWEDYGATGGDTDGAAIRAQAYRADGTAIGGTVLVNTQTEGDQTAPALAARADGGFVVTWTDAGDPLGDTSGTGVKAQVFALTSDLAIASNGGAASVGIAVAENGTAVTTVHATAPGGGVVVYAIAGGADAGLFRIDAATGALAFRAAPDFERPGDAGQDNAYDVIVSASDGIAVVRQAITVSVTDVADLNLITGTAKADKLAGTASADWIDGKAAGDTMTGRAGDDVYIVDSSGDKVIEAAGEGIDTVQTALARYTLGKAVDALVLTDDGAHRATGNDLANRIVAGAGADTIDGRAGADTMLGGAGNDLYYVDNGADAIVELAGGGTDSVIAKASYALSAEVENLTLASGKTALSATGNAGANTLTGNANANVIDGQGGSDRIAGGKGADVLTGGAGADTFVFDTKAASGNADTITDFATGSDALAFSKAAFAGFAATGALDAAAFWSGAGVNAAHDADDRLIYNTTTGALWYDADGTGRARAVQVALLLGHPDLAAGDLLIVA